MPASSIDQPFFEFRKAWYFGERWVTMCVRVGLSHRKNGLLSALAFSMNLIERIANFVVYGLHSLGIEHPGVLDPLFADLAPAPVHRGIIHVGRTTVWTCSRTDDVQQILRVVRVRGVFHGVEVIKVAEGLVEAVHRRQEFILVAKVILAEPAVASPILSTPWQSSRPPRVSDGRAGLADHGHAGADRQTHR